MLTLLLIIAIIISCVKGFMNSRIITHSKTKLNVSTYFDDDDNRNYKRKKEYNYNYEYDSNFIMPKENILYTLVWFDCEDCKQLLLDVKKHQRNNISYINGSYYFFDENDETNTPIFYKNDELIATDIFSIYEELFYNKLNNE